MLLSRQAVDIWIVPVVGVSWFESDQAPGTRSWAEASCFSHSTEVSNGNETFCWQPSLQHSDADLKELFSQAGEVASANVIMDKFTGRSRGFDLSKWTT